MFRRAKAWPRLAALAQRDGDPREAATLYERAGDAFAWEASRAWDAAGEADRARTLLESALAASRGAGRWDRVAEIAETVGDQTTLSEACRRLAEMETSGPVRAALWKRAAGAARAAGRPLEAAEAYRHAQDFSMAGEMFLEGARPIEAIREFERSGALDRAASAAAAAGDERRARTSWRRARPRSAATSRRRPRRGGRRGRSCGRRRSSRRSATSRRGCRCLEGSGTAGARGAALRARRGPGERRGGVGGRGAAGEGCFPLRSASGTTSGPRSSSASPGSSRSRPRRSRRPDGTTRRPALRTGREAPRRGRGATFSADGGTARGRRPSASREATRASSGALRRAREGASRRRRGEGRRPRPARAAGTKAHVTAENLPLLPDATSRRCATRATRPRRSKSGASLRSILGPRGQPDRDGAGSGPPSGRARGCRPRCPDAARGRPDGRPPPSRSTIREHDPGADDAGGAAVRPGTSLGPSALERPGTALRDRRRAGTGRHGRRPQGARPEARPLRRR